MEARVEISQIASAIQQYRKLFMAGIQFRPNVEIAALAAKEDFTYGGPALNIVLGPGSTTPVNADIIAILMDLRTIPTAN